MCVSSTQQPHLLQKSMHSVGSCALQLCTLCEVRDCVSNSVRPTPCQRSYVFIIANIDFIYVSQFCQVLPTARLKSTRELLMLTVDIGIQHVRKG